ncbi:TolC family outer membrane protein [Roseateles sp. DAIF2]|uniref:TolC family outer membrane protein n=1 Tax=Roseateles sp. DAIF2 TaxID=2714952 RepID=UPI0018A2E922|nr:TolC family outer membrane protein [Roseateles sp. DAIF2]QPF73195.1 TolC family outer membrane protein [Roseateles sp. DAIF2]
MPKSLPELLLALACTAGLSLPAVADDLLQVYEQARAGDPVLAAAAATRGAAREGAVAARGALLPQWSLQAQYKQAQNGPEARSRELSSRVSQVLLDLARLAQWRSAEARSEGQAALLQAARQDLVLRVASAYFGVLGATDQLATVQANEDAFARQVRQAESRFDAGLGAQVDIEQARTYHALARANTAAARRSLLGAREALAEITGAMPGTLKPLGEALPAEPPAPADRQAWVETALRDNPALRAERLALAASEQSLAGARAAHLPTLSLGLDSGRLTQWPQATAAGNGRTDTTLGLNLTVPLFAGGATEAQRRQAAHQRDGARETLEQRRRQVARETLEQFDAVVTGLAQIEATRAAVAASAKALAATQTGQELGTRSMTDLLLAIQNQAAAQSAYSQARHQYVLARLQLQQAAGHADDEQLAAINALLR